jgi:DNA-binding GntR family transcriptional regulator
LTIIKPAPAHIPTHGNALRTPAPQAPARLSEALMETIEDEIVTRQLPPGTRLDEVELAQRFAVSRTPIREALIQLASAGLVELRPRRGAIVAQISPQRLMEMFDVMAELEALCGRLAARRITPEERQRLLAAHEACAAARDGQDPDRYFYLNESFHLALYGASHNAFLEEQARSLQRRLRPYRRLQLRIHNRVLNSFSEHQGIVDAILAGDEALTVTRIRDHIRIQGERFSDLIASL